MASAEHTAIFVVTTCASPEEAERIANALLVRRIIACASWGAAAQSRYWWQGKIESSDETPLLLKALQADFGAIEEEIRRLHSYQVPEIVAVEISAISTPYREWLESVITSASSAAPVDARRQPRRGD